MTQNYDAGDARIDAASLNQSMIFLGDLSSAATALVRQPSVALVSILFWSAPIVAGALSAGSKRPSLWVTCFTGALGLFWFGWAGAERIFFLRQLQMKPVSLKHLIALVTSFLGRFFSLALLCGGALACMALLAVLVGVKPRSHPVAFRVCTISFVVALDFALTFVPSALAFSTRSAREALRIGFAMIRQSWPRCGLYVFCPPLALNVANLAGPSHLLWGEQLAITAALTMVGLLAKGATAAFYLRERPSNEEDGAANI
jgi:hypothetical protein